MLGGLFGRRGGGRPDAAVERVKASVRSLLGEPDLGLTVSEIECRDPGCPGIETVILILRPGRRTRAVKVAGPIVEVTERSLRASLVHAGIGVPE